MVDHRGEAVDGDELLYVVTRARLKAGHELGTVVGTVMSNLGLEHALAELGVALKRAPVGDRYVMDQLQQGGWMLGGESSGHIICLDRTTTGDGIVAALQVLEFMVRSGCTLHELKAGMAKYPQHMINVPIEKGFSHARSPAVTAAVAEAESALGSEGRLLLRPSGTEPVLRVMVEGMDPQQVKAIAQRLAAVIGEEQARQSGGRAGSA